MCSSNCDIDLRSYRPALQRKRNKRKRRSVGVLFCRDLLPVVFSAVAVSSTHIFRFQSNPTTKWIFFSLYDMSSVHASTWPSAAGSKNPPEVTDESRRHRRAWHQIQITGTAARSHARTHTLKVCGPSLIDQNNVAAMAFSPARDLCCCNPSLCHLRSYWSFLFMMCPSPLLFGPAGQPLPMYRNNNWGIFVFRFHVWGLGFSSVHVCSPRVCGAYLSKHWLKCVAFFRWLWSCSSCTYHHFLTWEQRKLTS